MPRIIVPEAEAILDQPFPCLDKGFVRLVDYMGGDDRVVQAARVSYTSVRRKTEDAKLIEYLWESRHTSPFEQVQLTFHVKMPIFVARQWVRHRTARCLTGDTQIQFDLPGGKKRRGNQLYTLSLAELYKRFQPTKNTRPDKQGNPYYKRDLVRKMCLRSMQDDGLLVTNTISNVVANGIKPVVEVTFSNGKKLKATEDHRVLTEEGWLSLKEAYVSQVKVAAVGKTPRRKLEPEPFKEAELQAEQWVVCPGEWEECYEVSSLGRVRSYATTRSTRAEPQLKVLTIGASGYPLVSLSSNGKSRAFQVHRLTLTAFSGACPEGCETRHLNGIRSDGRLTNLAWGTAKENTEDRYAQEGHQRLTRVWVTIKAWEAAGFEEVFDLVLRNDPHAFVANGIVVHNCNEVSGRYSVMKDEFYVPELDKICFQATDNKQGRSGALPEYDALAIQRNMTTEQALVYQNYKGYIDMGVAKETARNDLPLSLYTEWYWNIDLHNIFHFLSLRDDSHAQYEIRVYAEAIAKCVQAVAPISYAAYERHTKHAIRFSAEEQRLLALFLYNQGDYESSLVALTDRQRKAFRDKLERVRGSITYEEFKAAGE